MDQLTKGNEMKTIKVPKKIGRPRVYKEVMSNKDRQQRWRDRVKADAVSLLKQLDIK
jgi:hypothetical protein